MNNFEPKRLKLASKHLEEKLKLFQKKEIEAEKKDAYKLENKKSSLFNRFIDLVFNS